MDLSCCPKLVKMNGLVIAQELLVKNHELVWVISEITLNKMNDLPAAKLKLWSSLLPGVGEKMVPLVPAIFVSENHWGMLYTAAMSCIYPVTKKEHGRIIIIWIYENEFQKMVRTCHHSWLCGISDGNNVHAYNWITQWVFSTMRNYFYRMACIITGLLGTWIKYCWLK